MCTLERKLVKGGIYSFLIGLLIGVLIISDKSTMRLGSGIIETTYESLRIYLFKLIRFSSGISLMTMGWIWFKENFVFSEKKTTSKEVIIGFIKAFLFVMAALFIWFFIINKIIG